MGKLWYQWVHDKLPCGKTNYPDTRTVYLGNKIPPDEVIIKPVKYPNNMIVSSRYTLLNFLPKNMFEQFHRIANFYFLCVALISVVIDGPVSPWTSIVPLVFVVVITAVKQGYEDILRHREDKKVNHRIAYLISDEGEEVDIRSEAIHVGNVIKVKVNEPIPCDMVLLSSDDVDGECSITTANLDGETNLKTFYAVHETKHLQSDSSFHTLGAKIECQQPIIDLYKFIGRIHVTRDDGETITQSLSAQNVLLRGCRLKNTPYVYGCAIYTGQDTKISLNSRFKAVKFSRVEKRMNLYLIVFLVILLSYSGIWTGLKYWWYTRDNNSKDNFWYVRPYEEEASFILVVEDYLSFMVLCNYVIPISMYVTIELMKFGGKLFFEWDLEMYDPKTDEPAKANTSDINEELGQVEFLFTDKTGTLTENEMKFRQCSVSGIKYEEIDSKLCFKSDIPGVSPVPIPSLTPELEALFTVLALCHTIRVDKLKPLKPGEYSLDASLYDYQASSPDEKALVEASARIGIVYHGIREEKHEVAFSGGFQSFQVRHILDFDPTRKRMSVIIETHKGEYYLLVKGAETAIFDRCVTGDVTAVEKHIGEYAMLGLRTLCIANRKLTREEYQHYDRLLTDARNSLEDRDEKLSDVFETIETDLSLLGATAVEDKLQDGVPETIVAVRNAGIQVWVLTGDKEETAVNISYSAGHFHQGMTEVRLTKCTSSEEVTLKLDQLEQTIYSESNARLKHALIMDGMSLQYALDEGHKEQLRHCCFGVVTVLCCRMSPLQKAQVVRLIKTSKRNPTTAAIGDGANDVSMIQEAHVGLGIMGKEGRQAVRCSDYAFGRFRFLQRALLVHGHYFYWRICLLVQYFFYKNVAMIMAQLYYTFFSAFSIQSIFETVFLTFYNVTMAGALPILIVGLYESPVRPRELIRRPENYKRIAKNNRMTMWEFAKWNSLGLYHSLVFFFFAYFAFSPGNSFSSDGKLMDGTFEFGTTVMTSCVIVVNIKLMLETYLWNWMIILGFIITFLGVPVLVFFYSEVLWSLFATEAHIVGLPQAVWGSGYVWLIMLLCTMTALLPDILMRAYTDNFDPMYKRKRDKKSDSVEDPPVSSSNSKTANGKLAWNNEVYDKPSPSYMLAYSNPALDTDEGIGPENIYQSISGEYELTEVSNDSKSSHSNTLTTVADTHSNDSDYVPSPKTNSDTIATVKNTGNNHGNQTIGELNVPSYDNPAFHNESFESNTKLNSDDENTSL